MASPALAADAIEIAPAPPEMTFVPDTIEPNTWSGFYAGAFGGYATGTFDTSVGDVTGDGFEGGVFVGSNMQFNNFVLGAEADLGYSGVNGAAGATEIDKGVFGSLRARAGLAFDPFMLYGTAGIAATRVTVDDGAFADTNTHLGWTAGVGADVLVTDNVFGRLEYRYTDYGSKDYDLGGTIISSGFDEHAIRAGIGMNF